MLISYWTYIHLCLVINNQRHYKYIFLLLLTVYRVVIPTGRYSDRSIFRQVVIPTGRYSDKQVVIPTGVYSDRSIFRQTGRYSDRSIFRRVVIPTGRYSDQQVVIPMMRGLTTINSYCGDE